MIDGILPPRKPKTMGQKPHAITLPPTVDPYEPQVIEPQFLPPEQMARETPPPIPDNEFPRPEALPPGEGTPPEKRRRFGLHFKRPSRKGWIIIIIVSILIAALIGGAVYAFVLHKDKPVAQTTAPEPAKVIEPPKPTTVAAPLTGIQVAPDIAKRPVVGVMIENSPDARPQSGLKDAGIVYEAIAEGGITRFMALFQETQPDYVGPIRSVRPYYLEWLQGYDAAIAHVGGSPEALNLIKANAIKDLDQFANSGSYHRITARYAPHNVYTSLNELTALSIQKGYTTSTFTGFTHKEDKPVTPPTITSIDMTLSGYLYNTHYDYDVATNGYKRSQAGTPHLDEKSGAQLTPKALVAIVVPYGIKSDGLHSDYQTTGSGKAFIFQDGAVTIGTWSKAGSKDPLTLTDATGAAIALNTGQAWITAVGTEGSVAYR